MTTLLVLYHSQEFGNTAAMAEAIAQGAKAAGAEVTLVNTNEARMDIEAYRGFDAAAFGTPDYYSYIAGGLKMFLDDWYIARKTNPQGLDGKPYGLFFTHGTGGRARGPFEELFRRMGTQVGETVDVFRAPDDAALEACRDMGRRLVAAAQRRM